MTTTLLGVAGWPVAHSASPAMHNAALEELGLDWLYVPVPLPPELFAESVAAMEASGFRGLNVTLPHKEAARTLAHSRSEAAERIGAANTLTFEDGAIHADNTDAAGFLDALGEDVTGRRALVLGAGGSARAVVWALLGAGASEVSVWNRTPERAARLAAELGARHAASPEPADLIVNCTTIGLDGRPGEEEARSVLGLTDLDAPGAMVDLVYSEHPSVLLEWAARAGSRTVGGLEVLVRQGARSLAFWTGAEPPLATMRAAAENG